MIVVVECIEITTGLSKAAECHPQRAVSFRDTFGSTAPPQHRELSFTHSFRYPPLPGAGAKPALIGTTFE